jgi:hypothetical protein
MNVKSAVKLVLVGALMSAPMLAFAAPPTVPPQPAPIPAAGLTANGTTDPVYAAVWDPVAGTSLIEYLGLNASQIGPTDMTANLDFGIFSGFSTTFAAEIAAGTVSNLQFEVFSTATTAAGDTLSVYTTSRNAASNALFAASASNAGAPPGIQGANTSINQWTTATMNAGAPNCAKANPCSVVANSADPRFWGNTSKGGDNYAGNLNGYGTAAHSSSGLGTSMSFYLLTGNGYVSNPFALTASATAYAGVWSVSTAGDLTYTVPSAVPLPAAAWLLLSGLAGLGAIGRRRNSTLAAA